MKGPGFRVGALFYESPLGGVSLDLWGILWEIQRVRFRL